MNDINILSFINQTNKEYLYNILNQNSELSDSSIKELFKPINKNEYIILITIDDKKNKIKYFYKNISESIIGTTDDIKNIDFDSYLYHFYIDMDTFNIKKGVFLEEIYNLLQYIFITKMNLHIQMAINNCINTEIINYVFQNNFILKKQKLFENTLKKKIMEFLSDSALYNDSKKELKESIYKFKNIYPELFDTKKSN